MNGVHEDSDMRTDDELWLAYRDPDHDDDGRALLTIYQRHRDTVLHTLADEGLTVSEMDERVGAVFLRALNREMIERPLAEVLGDEARALAHDPDWKCF